jgi:glycosyltransferase involved in cell wall biosynthesis
LNLISKLFEYNNEIIVIAPLDEYISYKEQFPGLKHIALNKLSRKGTNPISEISLIWELRRIYTSIEPDLIIHYTHKPNIFGGIAAKLSGIASVAVVTGLGYAFIHKGLLSVLTRKLYKATNKFHKAVIFENVDDKNLFIDTGLLDSDRAFAVKGCGVDIQYYSPKEEEATSKELSFCFAGRLLYDKGICEFVEAGRKLKKLYPRVQLWICGELDSGNPSMIKKEILLEWMESDLVRYYGFVEDIRPILAKCSCVVLPSYREGMPRVILEALAMAKAVIVSNSAGCRQTVDDSENGFICQVSDTESLLKSMIQFAQMTPENRIEMGKKGRIKAEKEFNSEKISKELFEIISQVYFCSK